MTAQSSDETLAEIDATLNDYVEWDGSADSASWAADGSHQRDTDRDPWVALMAEITAFCWQRLGARPDYFILDETRTFTDSELAEVGGVGVSRTGRTDALEALDALEAAYGLTGPQRPGRAR